MTHRIGVVGLETMGRIYAGLAAEFGLDVVGADVRAELRETFEAEFDADTHRDVESLLGAGVDAVVVATPNKFHSMAVLPALERGIDAFIEKPLGHDLDAAERLREAATETDATVMVGYYHRYITAARCLKEYLDAGALGEVTHVEARHTMRRGIPHRGSWYTSEEIAGGGVLMDKGTFVLDLLGYFFDDPAVEPLGAHTATAFGDTDDYVHLEQPGSQGHAFNEEPETNMFDVEDTATALLELETGTVVTMVVSWAENQPGRHEYRIKGVDAGAHLDVTSESEPELTLYATGERGVPHFENREIELEHNDPRSDQFARFLDAVRGEEPPEADPGLDHAVYVQRVVRDLYDAAV